MASALRELLATFRIDVDDTKLKEAHQHVEGFKSVLKTVGNALAEAFAVDFLKDFINEQIHAGAELKVMADRLGTDTDELQSMGLAAGEAGVSVESLTTGLRFLNRNISEAVAGTGEGAAIFSQLHIALKNADGTTRSSSDIMGEFADKVAAIPDAAKKTEVAMKLLGRGGAELIPLLNQGGAAFDAAREKMQELGGGLSKEFVEQAHQAEAANVRLEFSLKGLKSQVAQALFPVVHELVKELTAVTSAVVKFDKETNVLTTAMIFFGSIAAFKAAGSLVELGKAFGIIQPTIAGTVASFAGFAAPLLVIGLLYLLFDDLYTLMHGGESVIGDTLDELFGIGTAAQFAKDLGDALDAIPDILEGMGQIILQTLLFPFEQILDAAKGLGKVLGDLAGGHFADALKDFKATGAELGADAQKRGQAILDAGEGIGDAVTLNKEGRRQKRDARQVERRGYSDDYKPGGPLFQGPLPPAPVVAPKNIYGGPLGLGAPPAVAVHQKNDFHVQVHTASDAPKAVGEAVGQGISTSVQRTNDKARTALRRP